MDRCADLGWRAVNATAPRTEGPAGREAPRILTPPPAAPCSLLCLLAAPRRPGLAFSSARPGTVPSGCGFACRMAAKAAHQSARSRPAPHSFSVKKQPRPSARGRASERASTPFFPPHPPSPPPFFLLRYRVLDRAGDGTYGTVWRALHRGTGALVAIKQFRAAFPTWGAAVALREVRALRVLRTVPAAARRVVALREVVREGETLFLVFEHMVRGRERERERGAEVGGRPARARGMGCEREN